MRSPGASPCIKYGVSTAGSQALLAARNEQLMIGAGQPVSWHGSAGPSMQDSDMRSEGGVLHRVHPLHFSDDAVPGLDVEWLLQSALQGCIVGLVR